MKNAFPPFALATASSEAVLSGCDEPHDADRSGIVEQQIPIGSSELRTISVFLSNRNPQLVTILTRVFANDGRLLREMSQSVPPGERQWIAFDVDLSPLSGAKIGQFVQFQLDLPKNVAWLESIPDPAFPAKFCFRLSPPQPCFWPTNVLPETTGSNRFTGIWKSDPEKPFPQWLEISWKDSLELRGLELDFPNSAETPTHYLLEVFAENQLANSVEVTENTLQTRTDLFDAPTSADHVRLTIFATQNAPSVSISRIAPL